jgi:hypothetical protein
MTNEQQLEMIQKKWNVFNDLIKRIDEDRQPAARQIVEFFGERLATCPADPRHDAPGSYPGGLVSQAIGLTKAMKKMKDTFNLEDVDDGSIVIVGLFHELGKVGTLDQEYFIPENDNWKRQNLGAYYKVNEKISKLSIQERTLFILQHFGLQLTEEEFIAIRGQSKDPGWAEHRLAPTYDPMISVLLRSARDIFVRAIINPE